MRSAWHLHNSQNVTLHFSDTYIVFCDKDSEASNDAIKYRNGTYKASYNCSMVQYSSDRNASYLIETPG
jgi:hypothetical protein